MTLVGILHEGNFDREPLQNVVGKVLSQHQVDAKFVPFKAGGPIIGKAKDAIKYFEEQSCEIAVLVGDTDGDSANCREIEEFKKTYIANGGKIKIVVGCPDPSLEQWFFSDDAAIKNTLNIPGQDPIRKPSQHPKDNLRDLIDLYSKEDLRTDSTIYGEISQKINIANLMHDQNFKKFFQQLSNI